MKIYCLGIDWRLGNCEYETWPVVEYAYFSAIGTWSKGFNCECGEHNQDLIPPLLVQWERSSSQIADFSYNGIFEYTFITQLHVARFMQEHGFECEFYPVEYVAPTSKAKKDIVPYPYAGPQQYWVECETYLDLDKQASGVLLQKPPCSICGHPARYSWFYNRNIFSKSSWHGEKMFRIGNIGKSSATFVTQEGLDLLLSQNYSNLLYLEAGEIVD